MPKRRNLLALSPPENTPSSCVPSNFRQTLSHAEDTHILDAVLGINVCVWAIVVAELGVEMERFPYEAHLVSRVSLCPAAKISANKRLSTKTGKGNQWLRRQALVEPANAAARSKGTFLGAYYQRLRKRVGYKKAIVALAHRILIISIGGRAT